MSQAELFAVEDAAPPADADWKTFTAAGGRVYRYGPEANNTFPIDFGDGQVAQASRYKKKRGGSPQFRVVHPDLKDGKVFGRFTNQKAFLAEVARAHRERELLDKLQSVGKQMLQINAANRKLIEENAAVQAQLRQVIEERGQTDEIQPQASPGPGRPPRKKLSSKLCLEPVKIEWETRRLVPAEFDYRFPKVPLDLLEHQEAFASNEWRVLCAAFEMGTFSGIVWGKATWAKKARVHEKDLKWPRRSLVNRGFLRETGEQRDGSPVFELVWHPWYGPMEQLPAGPRGEELLRNGGGTTGKTCPKVPPNQTSPNKTAQADDSATPLAKAAAVGNRALSSGKGGERFARPIETLQSTSNGRKLLAFVGPKQMREEMLGCPGRTPSGAEWMRILDEEGDELLALIEQGQRMGAHELPDGKARAKFLIRRLKDRRTA